MGNNESLTTILQQIDNNNDYNESEVLDNYYYNNSIINY